MCTPSKVEKLMLLLLSDEKSVDDLSQFEIELVTTKYGENWKNILDNEIDEDI